MTTLDASARRIIFGTWGCALIVMVASAINAVLTYSALGDNRVLGLATGAAVDIALFVSIIGDTQLARHGQKSSWGLSLAVFTALMSLGLNVGMAMHEGRWHMAALHAIVPVMMVILAKTGQDYLIKFTDLSATTAPGAGQRQTPSTSPPLPGSQTTTTSDPPVTAGSWAPLPPASTSRQTSTTPVGTASYATVTSRPPATPVSPVSTTPPVSPSKPRLVPAAPPAASRKPTGDDTRVLALLAQGAGAQEVAAALGCSKRTAFRRMAAVKQSNEAKAAAS